ncbi:MAG: hypothetical protein HXY35_10890 [Chloroflexi bacterium]|nr:hypothetical protein [Chloroflexota bacterium]
MNDTAPHPKRTGLLIWMIVSQILAVVSLVPWLLMAGLSVMAFDQGSTPEAWTFVIAVWSYPIIPIILVIAAWVAYARRRNRAAAVLSGFSFAPPLLCIVVIWFSNALWFVQNGGFDAFRP